MKLTFAHLIGSLRILRTRVRQEGKPGLCVWVDTGDRAARAVGAEVSTLAHKNECEERELVAELAEVLADGRITPAELKRLDRILVPRLQRCAEREHDISEAVRL